MLLTHQMLDSNLETNKTKTVNFPNLPIFGRFLFFIFARQYFPQFIYKYLEKLFVGVDMKNEKISIAAKTKTIIKKCHYCGQIIETYTEPQKCVSCKKSFLPLNYFEKIHSKTDDEYKKLFAESHLIEEDDLIKGIYVLW